MEGRQIEDIVSVWERQPLFADQSDALVEEQRAGRLAAEPLELASLLRSAGQGAMAPVWNELHRLELPLLAVAGASDQRYGEAARRLAAAVPSGTARAVEHAGHAPQLQRPDAVAALLVDFLDEHFG
jgi:pimeloyl-ACP methyl ester carboxylesterase